MNLRDIVKQEIAVLEQEIELLSLHIKESPDTNRAEVLKTFGRALWTHKCVLEKGLEQISEQPTNYRGQWVSVKERLPLDFTPLNKHGEDMNIVISNSKVIHLYFRDIIINGVLIDENVTHWLELYPLPPVPEKD